MANSSKLGRRRTLQVLGVGGLAATGLLVGCGNSGEGGGGGGHSDGPSCDSEVDAQSQQLRTSLQYREASQEEGKQCSNCAQYSADAYGECGGCNVFTGPVQPGGHCLSWAALAEEG